MSRMYLKSVWGNKNISIILMILLFGFMVVGILIVKDYGVSWDEGADAEYGQVATEAYSNPKYQWEYFGKRKFYGPSYFMVQGIVGSSLGTLVPTWTIEDARHFVNFTSFLLSALAFYFIARKFVIGKAALVATLLFLTQPLLFGHAFINGKDTPFMAMFLISIAWGLYAISSFSKVEATIEESEVQSRRNSVDPPDLLSELSSSSRQRKALVFVLAAFIMLVYIELYLLNLIILPTIQTTIINAYNGQAWAPINSLFARSAQFVEVIPVTNYVAKATKLYLMVRDLTLIAGALTFSLLFISISRQRLLYHYRKRFIPTLLTWHKSRFLYALLLSGVVVGLSAAIRVFGLFGGVLISIAFITIFKAKSIVTLLVYWASALITLFAAWPFLWDTPIDRFLESLFFMIYHPWRGYVLYAGAPAKGNLLPWHYLPFLMTTQFTLPVIFLAILGTILLIVRPRSQVPPIHWRLILGIWLILPIAVQIIRNPWLYDNFRQFLFVTPTLVLIGSFAIEFVFQRIGKTSIYIIFALLVLLPGIVSLIRLHPFQYIYYNEIVGGVKGASRQYELDYWCTSYKQATEFVNENFKEGATIAYWGTSTGATLYAEDHINIETFHSADDLADIPADFIAICTRANIDQDILPQAEIISEIQVEGAPLVVIKKIGNSQ